MAPLNPFGSRATLDTQGGKVALYRLDALSKQGIGHVDRLPVSIKVLLEACLRNCDSFEVTEQDVKLLADWNAKAPAIEELPFKPARVLLAGLHRRARGRRSRRHARRRWPAGRRPEEDQPAGAGGSRHRPLGAGGQVRHRRRARENARIEFARNSERYQFLRWGQKAFDNFRVVPPATGIVHQVNLEYLAEVVLRREARRRGRGHSRLAGRHRLAHHDDRRPGRGRLGRGRHRGRSGDARPAHLRCSSPRWSASSSPASCREGATATDLVLTVTQMLRKKGVVGKFVEFYGPGVAIWRSRTAPPSPICRRSTARPWASSPSTSRRSSTCASRAQRGGGRRSSKRYTKEQGLCAHRRGDRPSSPTRSSSTWARWSRASPVPSARRIASRSKTCEERLRHRAGCAARRSRLRRSRATRSPKRARDEGRRAARRLGRDRGDHLVHEHLEPVGAGGRRARGEEGRREGPDVQAVVKTSLAPGSRVVTDYLAKAGSAPVSRAARLQPRRLRLHDLHRQLRPAARTRRQGRRRQRPRRRRSALRQPQLRGPRPPAGEGELPRLPPLVVAYALAGHIDRLPRAARHGQGRQRVFDEGRVAHDRRGGRGGGQVT